MANSIVCVPTKTGQAYWFMGDMFTFLVTGEESGRSYFTMEISVVPGNGPGPHIHHLEDEQFYILEGNLTYWVGDQTFQVSAGDFIHIPRGTVHAFKNGISPAKLLVTFSPAGIEKFFQEVGEPVIDRTAQPPRLTEEVKARAKVAEANGWKEHHETLPRK